MKNEPLEHYLARQMKPDLAFEFKETMFHGERVVALIIPAAKDIPTAFDRTRYFRIGSGKSKSDGLSGTGSAVVYGSARRSTDN